MDYDKITEKLIQTTMKEFKLERIYQEFLDSLVKFKDFKNLDKRVFQKYLDDKEL